ncbi:MAG TPA: hypothetical protein VNF04_06940, partial [Stellaceae bacterium]|nr:hypothetical protein [Stellaceae bacterium]
MTLLAAATLGVVVIAAACLFRKHDFGGEGLIMIEGEVKGFMIDKQRLPADFPTHRSAPEFWEALGRTVATFGFLEYTLARAIFAFTGTRRIPPDEEEAAFEKWLLTLEKALTDQLGRLIDSYAKAVRANSSA